MLYENSNWNDLIPNWNDLIAIFGSKQCQGTVGINNGVDWIGWSLLDDVNR